MTRVSFQTLFIAPAFVAPTVHNFLSFPPSNVSGELRKPRQQRQRHETKGRMIRTIAVHVRRNVAFLCRPLQKDNVK